MLPCATLYYRIQYFKAHGVNEFVSAVSGRALTKIKPMRSRMEEIETCRCLFRNPAYGITPSM